MVVCMYKSQRRAAVHGGTNIVTGSRWECKRLFACSPSDWGIRVLFGRRVLLLFPMCSSCDVQITLPVPSHPLPVPSLLGTKFFASLLLPRQLRSACILCNKLPFLCFVDYGTTNF
jgi:hypothetical protein